ncbi:MAG TPA: protein kinase [Egibacteraceae bacterium]|nr:protein kinase [Egibacteraceae bacterium]
MTSEDIGRRVGGRYVLRSRLGSGGAGTVWAADDVVLERAVAVKSIRVPAAVPDGKRTASHERVLREARAAARLNHPGAVTVFDVFDEDGCAYLVMELVRAPSLEELVSRKGPLTPADAARMGMQLLDALEAAHARGIVHRDVKPSNVLVSADGLVKLTDFGIATVTGDSRLTATGLVLGSPSYMAPEQAREGAGRVPADLWGLGATLYFAVEGFAPFDRAQPLATVHAVLHDEPRRAQRAGALGPLLIDLLAKDPAQRPAPDEVRRRLREVVTGAQGNGTASSVTQPLLAMAAPPAVEKPAPAPGPPVDDTQAAPPPSPASWRRPALVAVLAALLGVAALGGAAAFMRGDDGTEGPAAGPPPVEQAPQPAPPEGSGEEPAPDEAPADVPEEPAPPAENAADAPADWVTYTHDLGWSIEHPADWRVVTRSSTMVDLRDPDSPTYLRVDYTDDPPPSAVEAWEAMSASFASRYADYTELRIEPVTFRGFDGALWEYTYTDGGLRLRAANLGFGTDEFGQALNFQTTAAAWEASQDLHEMLRRSFRPIPR